jgi:hypothetical protein
MILSPDASTLLIAGRFATLDGTARPGIGGVNPTTGALMPWSSSFPIRDNSNNSSITALRTDGTSIYGSGYTFSGGGNFEGTFSIDKVGNINWLNSCHGDTYDIGALNSVLYSASHAHDCSDIGAWEETTPRIWHRAQATTTARGANCVEAANNNLTYANYAGQPCSILLGWDPNFAAGSFTGAEQGPWAATGNSQYLVMGGEFPTVNGIAQYGLVRFAVPSLAPKKVAPIAAGTLVPNVVSFTPGTARITWKTTWDRDNQNLTYKLYRGTGTTNLIYTVTAASNFWNMPDSSFTDTGQSTSTMTKYHLVVNDPDGNTITIDATPGLVENGSATSTSPYYQAVLADGASNYWRLGEVAGTNAVNYASANDAITGTTLTRGVAGVLGNDTNAAATFDGTATEVATSQNLTQAPNTFTSELWFKTTTTKGGELIGYGSANTAAGTSFSSYDRLVYLDNSGHLIFGVNTTGATLSSATNNATTIASATTFNDGAWHLVDASLSSAGMALYADGKLIGSNTYATAGTSYKGYWRIGGDT